MEYTLLRIIFFSRIVTMYVLVMQYHGFVAGLVWRLCKRSFRLPTRVIFPRSIQLVEYTVFTYSQHSNFILLPTSITRLISYPLIFSSCCAVCFSIHSWFSIELHWLHHKCQIHLPISGIRRVARSQQSLHAHWVPFPQVH